MYSGQTCTRSKFPISQTAHVEASYSKVAHKQKTHFTIYIFFLWTKPDSVEATLGDSGVVGNSIRKS